MNERGKLHIFISKRKVEKKSEKETKKTACGDSGGGYADSAVCDDCRGSGESGTGL